MKRFLVIFFLFLSTLISAQTQLELPEIRQNEIIIHHTGFTLSYNPKAMIPNWVAYALHRSDMDGDAQRETNFSPDPSPKLLRYKLAEHYDYTRSGWARGHMAPAGDMKYSQKAMSESFYTTNVCPMDVGFNNGIWKRLEEKTRQLARDHGVVYIITGPIIGSNKYGNVGQSKILIPDAFYKALLVPYRDSYVAIAFIMPNETAPKGSKMRDYAITIKELEDKTGCCFYKELKDNGIKNKLPLKELGFY